MQRTKTILQEASKRAALGSLLEADGEMAKRPTARGPDGAYTDSIEELLWAFGAAMMRVAGFSARDLVSASDKLVGNAQRASVLRSAGYSATDLRCAGADLPMLLSLKYSLGSLRAASYSINDVREAAPETPISGLLGAGFSILEILVDHWDVDTLTELRLAGLDAKTIVDAATGGHPEALVAAGYCASDLRIAGYSAEGVASATTTACAAAAGYTLRELRHEKFRDFVVPIEFGYTVEELAAAGFDRTAVERYRTKEEPAPSPPEDLGATIFREVMHEITDGGRFAEGRRAEAYHEVARRMQLKRTGFDIGRWDTLGSAWRERTRRAVSSCALPGGDSSEMDELRRALVRVLAAEATG
jgi:hypothetical protein